jgi:(p)ppGpp synthase/HD superfamily hydrolase
MTFSDKSLEKAYRFAKKAHGDEKDRYGNNLFTSHVLKVFEEAGGKNAPTELGITALLHDVLEKTSVQASEITEKFGYRISRAVVDLSRNPQTPYFDYVRALSSNPIAVSVKRADLLANLASTGKMRLSDDPDRMEKYQKALAFLSSVEGYDG